MIHKRLYPRLVRTLAIYAAMAIFCLCASMQAWAQEPSWCKNPLTAQDVSELLEAGVPEERIQVEFVLPCGVDFQLTAELEKRFRDLGASDRLITAIREKAPTSCEAPLSVDQVVNQLQAAVSVERLRRNVAACGVSFAFSEETETRLREVGATDELIAAIREKAPAVPPPPPAAPVVVTRVPTPQPVPVAREPVPLPKVEVFGSYSLAQLDAQAGFTGGSSSSFGWLASANFNVWKNLSVVADVGRRSWSASETIPDLVERTGDFNRTELLFGPRFSFRRGKATGFVHGLFGIANTSTRLKGKFLSESPPPDFDSRFSVSGVAAAVGGGVDLKRNDRFSIRIVQVDYFATAADEAHRDIRLSFGIVIRID